MKKKILIILFVLLLFTFWVVFYKFTTNVHNFREHREYFKKPFQEQKIEDWMPLNYIERRYKIDMEKTLWVKLSFTDMTKTLKQYCTKKKLKCEDLIITLESSKNGHK